MPKVTAVKLTVLEGQGQQDNVAIDGQNFRLNVTATIEFTEIEQELEMLYRARIVLYEMDRAVDTFSFLPNWNEVHVLHQDPSDDRWKDADFEGFSPSFEIRASESNPAESIHHIFDVELDANSSEYRAFVLCVPATATAIEMSRQIKVTKVIQ